MNKNTIEQTLLSLYFPQFKSKNCSRFESFFQTIQKNYISSNNEIQFQSKIIYPEKIVSNEDKRTSIMIRGIPSNISKKEIRNLIERYGNINYLYIVKEKNTEIKSSVAYVNVINYKTIIPMYMNLRNFHFNMDGNVYNLKIMYSSAQGKKHLKQYIKRLYFSKNLD